MRGDFAHAEATEFFGDFTPPGGRSLRELVEIAQAYSLEDRDHIAAIQRVTRASKSKASKLRSDCWNLGLLTKGTPGRSGGDLTETGRRLAAEFAEPSHVDTPELSRPEE